MSQSQLEDSLEVRITNFERIDQTLPVGGGFAGDGDYVSPCEDCAEGFFPDGVYVITVTGRDLAGNVASSDSTLDKNIDGPEFLIERPRDPSPNQDPSGRFHFQFADSLVGVAGDRQTVDSVTASIVAAPDTIEVFIPRTNEPSSFYLFNTELSGLLTAEGVYDFTLTAYDEDQVSSDERLTIVIDRTPDPPPLITPRPPARTKQERLQFRVTMDDSLIREVIVSGGKNTLTGSHDPDTLDVRVPSFEWQRDLDPGPNLMSFETLDYARNISEADTMTVVWETTEGLIAPERFLFGQSIQVDVGSSPAQNVIIRVLALDGSLVRTFQDNSARLVYAFPWDLTTPEGRPVKNGAYLIYAQVRYPDGRESRFRRMIAVVR